MNIFVAFWFAWFLVFMCIGLLNFLGTPSLWHVKTKQEEEYYIKRELYIIICVLNMLLGLICMVITHN